MAFLPCYSYDSGGLGNTMIKDAKGIKSKYVTALFKLCESKSLKKITVGDLLQETGTARQTFYNHFRDINDFIVQVPILFFEQNYRLFYSPDGSKDVFRYVIEHKNFFSQLPYHNGQNCFRDSYLRWIKKSYYQVALEGIPYGAEYLRRKSLVDVYLYGVTDLFLEWCKSGMEWPPEVLISVIYDTKPDFISNEVSLDFKVAALD